MDGLRVRKGADRQDVMGSKAIGLRLFKSQLDGVEQRTRQTGRLDIFEAVQVLKAPPDRKALFPPLASTSGSCLSASL